MNPAPPGDGRRALDGAGGRTKGGRYWILGTGPEDDGEWWGSSHHCTRARMTPDRYSSPITITMMMSRIAAAVSYS